MSISHPAIARRIVERLDSSVVTPFGLCSDSNGLFPNDSSTAGRFGWWGGLQFGLMQHWPLAGSGLFMPGRLKDSVAASGESELRAESHWSHDCIGYGVQDGAPTDQHALWDDDAGGLTQSESGSSAFEVIHPHTYRYCAVDDATLPANPRVFPGILRVLTTNPIHKHALKAKFWDVTFPTGAGKITPCILEGTGLTTVAGGTILDTNQGATAFRKTELTLAADPSRTYVPNLTWGPNDGATPKTKLQGPLMVMGSQVLSSDVVGGFTVSVLCQLGGAIVEMMDVALRNLCDAGLDWWLGAVTDDQAVADKHLVIVANYGINDYTLGISFANWKTYLTNGVNRLKARWSALGYPAHGLLFIFMSPQGFGTDAGVAQAERDYRDGVYQSMVEVAESVGNATAIDTEAIVPDAVMENTGWMYGAGGHHLTFDGTSALNGYQAVGSAVISALRVSADSAIAVASTVVDAINADATQQTLQANAEGAATLLEADQFLEDVGGTRKLKTYRRGTVEELIPAKTAKQPDGTDLTDPVTQRLAGYRQ